MLPPIVIRLLLPGVAALLIGRLTIKDKSIRQVASSISLNGIWAYVVSVKASLLLTHFKSISSEPLLLLYGWGGLTNTIIGAVGVLSYFAWFLIKKSSHPKRHALFIGTTLASFLTIFSLIPFLTPSEENVSNSTELSLFSNLKSVDGASIPFNNSEITVVNFWATWCPPCRAEMPELDEFATEHPEVNFIGVNNITSETKGAAGVKEFLQSKGYHFPTTLDFDDVLTKEFSVKSFPTTLVFDATGKLLHRHVGVISKSTLEDFLSE